MTQESVSGPGPGKTPAAGIVTPDPARGERYLPKRDEISVANVLAEIKRDRAQRRWRRR